MISSKTLRIAGAAILGTLVGTSPAYAQIYLDGDGDSIGQLKIALETLSSSTEVEGTKYYHIPAGAASDGLGTFIDTAHVLGVNAAASHTVRLTYTLENMVFLKGVNASTFLEVRDNDRTTPTSGAEEFHVSGGAAKSDTVAFSVSGAALSAAEATANYAVLNIAQLGVAATAGGTTGSIKMAAAVLAGGTILGSAESTIAVVNVAPVLNETPTSKDVTALVSEGFTKFSQTTGTADTDTEVALGSLTLGVKSGFNAMIGDVLGAATLLTTPAPDPNTNIAAGGRVTFEGEVSFAKAVFLDGNANCDSGTNISLIEDKDPGDGVMMGWRTGDARPSVSMFSTAQHLCIEVDGDTPIPAGAYTATTAYTGVTDAAFPPTGQTITLGSIKRDGTTVYIPTLTTSDVWNQRIVIWNRGSSAVPYSFAFTADGAEAGTDAEGMLQPGITNLSLRNDDVVNLGENDRTAATLQVTAPSGNISVATIRVNRDTRATDTVHYQ